MTQKVNHFLKLLKHQQPECYDRISVSVSSKSNYIEYRGIDGRMRAELNYNSPAQYDIEISFPNVDSLYYDMSFYIDYVWGGKIDVAATFDFNGTNHFRFTE
jgi:hypothetical protein